MPRRYLVFLLLLLPIFVFGNASDSVVRYSDIRFSSAFEAKAFGDYVRNPSPKALLMLLMATDPAVSEATWKTAEESLDKFTQSVATEIASKKTPQKKVKQVFEMVHGRFLRQYIANIGFSSIFTEGLYNCVTATALYSYIFEQLGIPYDIQELPTHVYLVAYPGSENIKVETTAPVYGFLTYNEVFKANFVQNMKKGKIISEADARSMSYDQIFNKYYFGTDKIDFRRLVGIHYLNDAIFKMEDSNPEGSLAQAVKANFLYPAIRSQSVMLSAGVQVLREEKIPAPKRARSLGLVSRVKEPVPITVKEIEGEFAMITQDVLNRASDRKMYADCFAEFTSTARDSSAQNSVAFIYYYETGRHFFNLGKWETAKHNLAKALDIHPNDVDLSLNLLAAIGNTLDGETNPQLVMDTLSVYEKRFPALKDINRFHSFKAYFVLFRMAELAEAGKATESEKVRAQFEELYKSQKPEDIEQAIGRAYSSLCAHYFRKGQKSKAREIVKKGLEMAPNSNELRLRQMALN